MYGTSSSPLHGGLAAQVLALPAGEVQWDYQPHHVFCRSTPAPSSL
jgi:hypothetical protein